MAHYALKKGDRVRVTIKGLNGIPQGTLGTVVSKSYHQTYTLKLSTGQILNFHENNFELVETFGWHKFDHALTGLDEETVGVIVMEDREQSERRLCVLVCEGKYQGQQMLVERESLMPDLRFVRSYRTELLEERKSHQETKKKYDLVIEELKKKNDWLNEAAGALSCDLDQIGNVVRNIQQKAQDFIKAISPPIPKWQTKGREQNPFMNTVPGIPICINNAVPDGKLFITNEKTFGDFKASLTGPPMFGGTEKK